MATSLAKLLNSEVSAIFVCLCGPHSGQYMPPKKIILLLKTDCSPISPISPRLPYSKSNPEISGLFLEADDGVFPGGFGNAVPADA